MRAGLTAGRIISAVLTCAALAVVTFVFSVAFGEQTISWSDLSVAGSAAETIFYSLRLPHVVLAAIVGAALATSGTVLQSLMRNPLADPFVLGVSGGAALGGTLALALGLTMTFAGLSAEAGLALVGAIGATALVLAVGRFARGDKSNATLLAGVIFNSNALAAILFIKVIVAPDKLGEVLFWLAGSLPWHVSLVTLAAVGTLVALSILTLVLLSGRLNLLLLGDEDAASLGLDVRRTRLLLFLLVSLTVSLAVSLSGLVGFVGLLVPHVARLIFGADQRVTVPTSAFLGAAFLMLADLSARLMFRLFDQSIPVGVVTALLGGPLFLLLMMRRRA